VKDRIKQVRKSQNLTQTAFGDIIGVKGNTITNSQIYKSLLSNDYSCIFQPSQ
jgi:transcriptional regulator with XRE-family HTH domain